MMRLGLIGGLGVPAGIHYYESIARAARGTNTFPLLLAHADLETTRNFVVAGDVAGLSEYLAGFLTSLSRAGATVGAIAAVTPHVCLEQLRAASPIPIIDMPAALNAELKKLDLHRIALFGTSFVVETDLFGYLDVEAVRPSPEEIADLDSIYLQLARGAKGTQQDRERVSGIAYRLLDREGVEAIVLAGTDFVALYDSDPPEFRAVDASRVHVDAICATLLA
jgi:aspartate racemase